MMTPYCIPCIYCRRFTDGGLNVCCHYYLDTGKKLPCPGGDGCTERVILPPDERLEYIKSQDYLRRTVKRLPHDWHEDDFIADSRGIVGEDYSGDWR